MEIPESILKIGLKNEIVAIQLNLWRCGEISAEQALENCIVYMTQRYDRLIELMQQNGFNPKNEILGVDLLDPQYSGVNFLAKQSSIDIVKRVELICEHVDSVTAIANKYLASLPPKPIRLNHD